MGLNRNNLILHILSQLEGMSYRNLAILLDTFGTPDSVVNSDFNMFEQTGLDPVILSQISEIDFEYKLEEAKSFLEKQTISLLSIYDGQYPELLKQIPKLPLLLYTRGDQAVLNQTCLSVVGTRKISPYATSIIPKLLNEVTKQGIVIVSGLAYGVDGAAHTISVKNNVPTIAVLAGGIDDQTIYPKDHLKLAHAIIESGGLIVSEYPPYSQPQKMNFPVRNRIIAGLSKGTLVVECAKKSGALITVSYALDQNRDVLAVPGSIQWENSVGTNDLIKKGALVITSADDLLGYFDIQNELPTQTISIYEEDPILKHLLQDAKTLDELIELSNMAPSEVASTITALEIEGVISKVNGNAYIIINS